ncbi:hypothetical protein K443DRAFT_377119 [Laccaria amethystina LaAM-08-1]|uniref:Actin-like ATPase domain-containing protein n=1 Tax=Laccaria amethystina LaAM-08-1 TaxID=1095629 RepID=A0A0C9WY67_9AGAR|nr:hypothetical protein K443DRAFT_377119 [Laccaria amethystina LaAM-08-1]
MSTTDGNRSSTTGEQTVLAFDSTSEETQVIAEGFPDLPRRSLLMHVPSSVTHRKLVLAFDVGTTFSGISYCILDPEIRSVARFPAGDEIRVFLKIPTAIYYDTHGKVRAAGAEVSQEGIYETAEEEGWTKAEWFKHHFRPEGNATASQLPPLPPGKSVIDVLADFLRYLFQCTQTYIEGTYPRDANLWPSLVNDMDFLLSHPNGWGVPQQTQMREAAVFAGLVPDDRSGRNRIFFVTEGEANLHFAIHNGLSPSTLMESEGVIIVDAGGGTIDISDFACNADIPTFNEIAPPQCHFHGSVFVSINARNFLEVLLSESPFIEDLQHIVRCFDRTTKLRFRNPEEASQFIKFGSTRDNDLNCNIRFGQLKLKGDVVAGFFEPSIQCIIEAVHAQHKSGQMKSKNVILVGGFAANDWLYTQVVERLKPDGFTVIRPDHGCVVFLSICFYYS